MAKEIVIKPYVLLTAARNEAAFIRRPIESVINQTVLPEKWIIISDSSIDETDEIVGHYAKRYPFIKLLRITTEKERNFTSKVKAIEKGCSLLKDIKYEFLGILDADVSFGRNYYEYMLEQFHSDVKLGLAGGQLFDIHNGKIDKSVTQVNRSVTGAIQMFRRQCYEDIGGYTPQRLGGTDAVAEFMARMHGWKVQTFPSVKVFHYRRESTEGQSIWYAKFYQGLKDYTIGYHPIYEILKCIRRFVEKPLVLGGLFWMAGYFFAASKRYERTLPYDVIKFIRKEQMSLLLKPFFGVSKEGNKQ